MKMHSYWQAVYQSFYSMNLYRDVAKRWGASVVLYLLLILSLSWAVSTIAIQQRFNEAYRVLASQIVSQMPVVKVKNGIVSTPEKRPYYIKLDNAHHNLMVIDTTGTYKTLESANTYALVTKDTVYYTSQGEPGDSERIVRFPKKTRTFDFVPKEMDNLVSKWVNWSWVIIFPSMVFLSLVYHLTLAVVYAVFGKLFAILSRISLPYSVILKLSMFAMTPALAISTVLFLLGMSFENEWILYFVVTMIYLNLAVRANK